MAKMAKEWGGVLVPGDQWSRLEAVIRKGVGRKTLSIC